uniref:Cadherin domain-containing protein n=1 Tax=Meloidogyne incognita TaxID=6306 RepID=A0A914N8N9_MELIC
MGQYYFRKYETTTKPLQYTNNSPLSSFSIPPQLSSSNQTISKYPSTTTTNSLSTNYLNSTTTLSSIVLPVSSSSQLIYTSTDSPQLQIGDKKEESTRLAPIFASAALKIFVEENEEQLELATLSANYPDEGPGPINYVLLAGDQSLFSINASNGVITLLKALDAESTSIPSQPPIYHLKVGTIEAVELQYLENGQKINLVTDTGLAHFCDIQINVVDINDWIPNFEQNLYEFTIPATAEPGTIIGQVHAFDQDITSPNNKLFYYIIPKKNNSSINSINAEQFFSLNSQTGQLKTLSNLKNFAGRILKFRIQVVDGGVDGNKLNSTAEIAVHLEGVRRHEEKKVLPTTTISWQGVEEVDEEEDEENEEEKEKQKEGEQLKEKQQINNKLLSSTEKTTKQYLKSTTEELNIENKNISSSSSSPNHQTKIKFSSHYFNSSIMEGTRPPVFLTILPVINKTSDTRFTICAIRTGNLRGAFSVAQNGEGNCELRTQMQLDREAIPNYLLNITVENGGQQDWTLANISVLDVNDNKPKFVFNKIEGERKNEKLGTEESFFAVLPIETMANQRFYKITAEDGDEPGNGNSLINYSIDTEETTQGEVGNLFGIDPQSGELWPKKGADELAQISKKNFFRITVIACDNPGEQKRRLCSRAPVSISILDDRHRFVLIFSGESAEQIKHQEKEILNSLRPFTFPCSNPIIERIEVEEGEEDIKKYLKRSKRRE